MELAPFASNLIERRAHALKARGEWRAAAAEFSNAVLADPWNLEARYEKAICLVELKRYDEALAEYQGVASLSSEYVHLHYNEGMIHVFRHDWQAAADAFARADATAAVPRGFDAKRALRIMAGDLDRAHALYELALSIDPEDRAALNNLAGIHFQRRAYDEAIPLCERMLKQDTNDAHVAVNLAKAWYMKGDAQRAEEILRAVLASDPSDAEALGLMQVLRSSGE